MQKSNVTYYEVLNISPRASDEDVKRAYRIMAKIYHPDQNPQNAAGAHKRFQKIKEAYEALRTHEKRKHYDRSLRPENDNTQNAPIFTKWAELFRPQKNRIKT